MRLGLIGNGAIAKSVTAYCKNNTNKISIVGSIGLDRDIISVGSHPIFTKIDNLFDLSPDVIVECAGNNAVEKYANLILSHGIDLVIISVGALANDNLYKELLSSSVKYSSRFFIPSGALAGLDAIESAKVDGLKKVFLRTTKKPKAWFGAPGVKNINLNSIKSAQTIFNGTARDAARLFPKNANVAAALALSGIGMDETNVELVADPNVKNNFHYLRAEGTFGKLEVKVDAVPSLNNPKTSHLAALSIINQLEKIDL